MDHEPRKGEKVEWNSHGGKSKSGGKGIGKVLKKLTSPTKIKGTKIKASKDDPRFLVESEKSGGQAAHKASALKKPSKS